MIGKTITGYKILKRIGKGGMGSVYLAKHTTLDKHAAIKVIDKKYSSDPEIKKRFKREAVLHSKLAATIRSLNFTIIFMKMTTIIS